MVVVLAAAAAGTATPAGASAEIAASSRCEVDSSGNCTTAAIPSGAFIDIHVDNRPGTTACSFQLREASSGVLTVRGRVIPGGVATGRVTGLSGRYQLELRRCSAGVVGEIDNE